MPAQEDIKVVVMNPSGEILEMFLDDPVNNASWVS
jgi:hypothetical protein